MIIGKYGENMELRIKIYNKVNVKEFQKSISFVSDKIINYEICGDEIILQCEENCNPELITDTMQDMMKKFVTTEDDNNIIYEKSERVDYHTDIMDSEQLFVKFGQGMYGLKENAKRLYELFGSWFAKIGHDMGGEEKSYPVLLPVDDYQNTGYIRQSPQYAMFCSNLVEDMQVLEQADEHVKNGSIKEIVKEPVLALSPSACFHTYIEYKQQILEAPKVVTFTQSVFRNEGRLNYDEVGRLRDYHVREIVFLGDEEFVRDSIHTVMDKAKQVMERLGLDGTIERASDPFIMPKMQKYKKIQIVDCNKYELRLHTSKEKKISVASFNQHGTAFTYPFNIRVRGCENSVTGCVGFGVERWVIAFLSQYGENESNWPKDVKELVSRRSTGV